MCASNACCQTLKLLLLSVFSLFFVRKEVEKKDADQEKKSLVKKTKNKKKLI